VPADRISRSLLVATFAQLGQLEEARAEAAELLRVWPSYASMPNPNPGSFKHANDGKRILDGLRKAGLRE
jgi:adenylate cyclase